MLVKMAIMEFGNRALIFEKLINFVMNYVAPS